MAWCVREDLQILDFRDRDFSFKELPGNYVFAKRTASGGFVPIYVGETGDLSERFDDHHKKECIIRRGATHLHAHTSSAEREKRAEEEQDIIVRWTPPCND